MADNCSDTPPQSGVFLSEASVVELVFLGVVTVLAVWLLILFADQVWFIHRHHSTLGQYKLIKHKSYVLVGLYPVTAVAALMATYIPRSSLLCDFIASVYLAVCLYEFTSLIVLHFGGTDQLVDGVQDVGFQLRTPPCCCCCCCCPTIDSNKKNLNRLKMLVMQTAFIQPIVSFISVVLWLDDQFDPHVTKADSPNTYLTVMGAVSILLAIYGLHILHMATFSKLAIHSIKPKFNVLQVVLAITGLQKLILGVFGNVGLPPCRGVLSSNIQADAIHHMLVVAEMFLLAIFARIVYRRPIQRQMAAEYRAAGDQNVDQTTCCGKVREENGAALPSYRAMSETVRSSASPVEIVPAHSYHESI